MTSSWFLVLSIGSLLSSSVHSKEWLDCGTPVSYAMNLGNNQKSFVYDAEIKIKYDRNELEVYEYPGLDAVNLLVDNTIIEFSGYIVPENQKLDRNVSKTFQIFNSRMAGYARRMKSGSKDVLTDCSLFLSKNRNEEELYMAEIILNHADICAKQSLCQKFGFISLEDLSRGKKNSFDFGSLSVLKQKDPEINENDIKKLLTAASNNYTSVDRDSSQDILNKIVDLYLTKFIKLIDDKYHGKMELPDMRKEFPGGEIVAFGGTFYDLRTLSRIEDARLSNKDLKYVLGGGFGLSQAIASYHYMLRFGFIKVQGEIVAGVKEAELSAAIAVDYNQNPCKIVLEELRVTKVGFVGVLATGLGPLNGLLSIVISLVTNIVKDNITVEIEKFLSQVATDNLNKINCEMYRP